MPTRPSSRAERRESPTAASAPAPTAAGVMPEVLRRSTKGVGLLDRVTPGQLVGEGLDLFLQPGDRGLSPGGRRDEGVGVGLENGEVRVVLSP